jgi:hypothetical protein
MTLALSAPVRSAAVKTLCGRDTCALKTIRSPLEDPERAQLRHSDRHRRAARDGVSRYDG